MSLFRIIKNRKNTLELHKMKHIEDVVSNYKMYRDYYPKYVCRSTPAYIKITDCIDCDDYYTKITIIGHGHYNMLRRKFNAKKFNFKRKSSFRNYVDQKVYHINGRAYRDMFKFK